MRFSVSATCIAGSAPCRSSMASIVRSISAGVDERAHGVVDQHHARRVVAQRAQGKAGRFLPGRAAMDRHDPLVCRSRTCRSGKARRRRDGWRRRCRPIRGWLRKAWIVWDMTGRPADRAVLFRAVSLAGPLAAAGRDDDDGCLFRLLLSEPSCMARRIVALLSENQRISGERHNFALVPGCVATGNCLFVGHAENVLGFYA